MEHYDFLILGAGSGGIASGNRAAALGARVAVIEMARLGGTCVNLGCVPKKIMWNAAQFEERLTEARAGHLHAGEGACDFGALVTARERYIAGLNARYREKFASTGVTLIEGMGVFVDEHTLAVGTRRFSGEHVLIATGARPVIQICRVPHWASPRMDSSHSRASHGAQPSSAAGTSRWNLRAYCGRSEAR